jgi:hypothetical protein
MLGGSIVGCYCLQPSKVGTTINLANLTPRFKSTPIVVPSDPPFSNYYALLDSGTTGNFVTPSDAKHLDNSHIVDDAPIVLSASGDPMVSQIRGQLPLSRHLSLDAKDAFVLDNLKTRMLISLAKLCDDDCIALFTKHDVKIIKNDTVIITGIRSPNSLWSIPLERHVHQANGILQTDEVKAKLASFHHATLGGPVPSTLLRAIRKAHVSTFPGLDTNLISKHLQKSISTSLGHQDQEAKNLRSTKTQSTPVAISETTDTNIAPPLASRTD